MNLEPLLPILLPIAVDWAETRSRDAAKSGSPLDARDQAIACAVGVRRPELIRVAFVTTFWPGHPALRAAAMQTGLLGPDTEGLTLGHSVLIRKQADSTRLRSHEFRHVQQYEAAGSIGAFLRLYFQQLLTFGYYDAPLEKDARQHERDA